MPVSIEFNDCFQPESTSQLHKMGILVDEHEDIIDIELVGNSSSTAFRVTAAKCKLILMVVKSMKCKQLKVNKQEQYATTQLSRWE